MTPRQRDALAFVEGFIRDYRISPTIREIAAGIGDRGISTSHKLITALVADGHLRHTAQRHRNIRLATPLGSFRTKELIAELNRRERVDAE